MKTYSVTVEGVSSVLLNRWSEDAEAAGKKGTRKVSMVNRGTPREQAEKVAYRNKDGFLYMPGTWFQACIKQAAAMHKMKSSRQSMKYAVAGSVIVPDECVLFTGKVKDYEVDSRPVVIPSTKGKIMRHRPRLDKWSGTFTLEIDDEIVDPNDANIFLEEAGKRVGVGDFRPQKGGPFGRFIITEWKELLNGNGKN